MTRLFGWTRILTSGAPAPGATVTVYDTGTLNLSTIYSDNVSTPKANPFVSDANGYWFFYGAERYDVQVSGAGITTYTQGDVPAIPDNIRWANVKSFGAVGDGTTNDATAIQNALASLPSTGGVIYFPPGTYLISSFINADSKTNIRFTGAGRSSILKTTTVINTIRCSGSSGLQFDNLSFLGNYPTSGPGQTAINFNTATASPSATNLTIRDCYFEQLPGAIFIGTASRHVDIIDCTFVNCLACVQATGGTLATHASQHIRVIGNYMTIAATQVHDDAIAFFSPVDDVIIAHNTIDAQRATTDGSAGAMRIIIAAGSVSPSNCTRIIIANNVVRNNAASDVAGRTSDQRASIILTGGGTQSMQDIQIVGNQIYNGMEGINCAENVLGIVIADNVIDTVQLVAMRVSGGTSLADISFRSNVIRNCGDRAIELTNTARPSVIGNRIISPTGNGVTCDGTTTAPDISHNYITGGAADGIRLNGVVSGTIIGNRITNNTGVGIRLTGTVSDTQLIGNRLNNNTGGATVGYTATISNLRGSITFAGAATAAVTFAVAEPDASYYVALAGNVNETFFVTAKTANGFTLNSSNAGSTAVVDWMLMR